MEAQVELAFAGFEEFLVGLCLQFGIVWIGSLVLRRGFGALP
jgi:hypothetical protein